MATLTKTHGSAFGVPHVDRATAGSGVISADETVILNGPQLDFFKISVNDGSAAVDLRNELDPGEGVEAILREVLTRANIEMYQVEGDANGEISVAVYPTGAWTAATLQVAVRALGSAVGANSIDVDTSTVADNGFELV